MFATIIARSQSSFWSHVTLQQFLAKPFQILHPFIHVRNIRLPRRPPPEASSERFTAEILQQMVDDVKRDWKEERERRVKVGLDTADLSAEENGDFLCEAADVYRRYERRVSNPSPNPRRLKPPKLKYKLFDPMDLDAFDNREAVWKREQIATNIFYAYEDLMFRIFETDDIEEAIKRIDKFRAFQNKYVPFRPEWRVFRELLTRLASATTIKEKFLLQMKLNRALWLDYNNQLFNPDNPAHYGIIQRSTPQSRDEQRDKERAENAAFEKEMKGELHDEEEDPDFSEDKKESEDEFTKKLEAIDKELEEKLSILDHTFGRKAKILDEEIRNLALKRNLLVEERRKPRYRKGFISHVLNINRTVRVLESGKSMRYTALVAVGNFQGVVGYGRGKGRTVQDAIRKGQGKSFQNLHYFPRHEKSTIPHAVVSTYKKTKVAMWPRPEGHGIVAGSVVTSVMMFAGYHNVSSKIIGSKNPHYAMIACFRALDSIETPQDMQVKLGRSVIQPHLLGF